MEFGTPDLKATVNISSLTKNKDNVIIDYNGEIENFGSVFFTHNLIAASDADQNGIFEGCARVSAIDGTTSTASLLGVWKREEGMLKIFSLDQWLDGGQFFVRIDVDEKAKTAVINANSLA